MARTLRSRLWCLTTIAALGAAVASPTHADDFSIENVVYDGDDRIGGSLTVFAAGKVYDFLNDDAETTVFDSVSGRIVLLDGKHKLRSELTTRQVADFCDRLRRRVESAGGDYSKFLAAPEFREQLDPDTNELVLASPYIEYRAKTIAPRNADTLRSYEQFLYWQTHLNTVVNAGSNLPYARLKFNEALSRRQLLAEEVTMRRTSLVPGRGTTLRAEHHLTWRLNEPERRRIAAADEQMGSFQAVSIEEYLQVPAEK